MKTLTLILLLLFVSTVNAKPKELKPQTQLLRGPKDPLVQKVYKDVEATLGIVPSFIRQYPTEGIEGAWENMKSVQLNPNSAIPSKLKELIGLGVSAQIPCHYCTYFHTEAARFNGANEQEIQESVAMAASTRHWSTYLNGMQIDEDDFRKETNKIINFLKNPPDRDVATESATVITDAASAYKDIEKTLGLVPDFMRKYPEIGIVGAWKAMKNLQLSPHTAISPKFKELIGLAVASQVPCRYCVTFHTEAAKFNGASEAEIKEAVAMASVTRHWSTVLNGVQTNEVKFRKEAQQIFEFLKRKESAGQQQTSALPDSDT